MGGYGAIRVGMRHWDVFGSVYAMHPVGTGSGVRIMDSLPNWDLMANAKSLDDVKKHGYSQVFTTIFQAHLPNPEKPPLFIDLPARKVERHFIDAKLTDRLRNSFFLEAMIPQFADNLKSLKGLKFDWGHSDPNHDHVFANQAFTHKLNEYGIEHEAEEHNGAWEEDSNWGESGASQWKFFHFFGRNLCSTRNKLAAVIDRTRRIAVETNPQDRCTGLPRNRTLGFSPARPAREPLHLRRRAAATRHRGHSGVGPVRHRGYTLQGSSHTGVTHITS